jgi:FkbM family methyltransferase
VVAFEPEPVNRACFQRTFKARSPPEACCWWMPPAWSEPGELQFQVLEENSAGGSSVRHSSGSAVTVPAVTIYDTVARLALERVDFLKLDIEGASGTPSGARRGPWRGSARV